MISLFLRWYLIVQLISVLALPLSVAIFRGLPGRGYAFAKSLGVLMVGFILWIGTSYGLLRNELGGAWLALFVLGVIGLVLWRGNVRSLAQLLNWRYMLTVEIIFLLGFAAWALVRAYDPAANHTEQPMDLMFMNSIWSSPTFPPQDAWLGGYPISYYYFGYWLLTTVGRLAGQPPEIAYNLGQANWYALLLLGSFGVGYNLLARAAQGSEWSPNRHPVAAYFGGLLSMIAVAIAGNLLVILEWLYAMGAPIEGLAGRMGINGFPERASRSGDWFINLEWWWWRSSRVIADQNLLGQHIEVIDEFPIFSYVLGDNHPHVLAMPFVLLVVGMLLNLHFHGQAPGAPGRLDRIRSSVPLGFGGILLLAVALGSLVFLNTWDYPPYWLLAVVVFAFRSDRLRKRDDPANQSVWPLLADTAIFGAVLAVGTLLIYLPYFLTAQSQAGGIIPNLFFPTRLPQFFIMFGSGLLALVALFGLAFVELGGVRRGFWRGLGLFSALVYGLPLLFLGINALLATRTTIGKPFLLGLELPEGGGDYLSHIVSRWVTQGWTYVMLGAMLALTIALVQQYWRDSSTPKGTLFALFMSGIGLLLVYAPEFVYLRDNFGTRMNTVFKFYYQGWLLIGLSGAYAVVAVLSRMRGWKRRRTRILVAAPAVVALGLMLMGMLFPVAGAYSKTGGFRGAPTFDATAYLERSRPAEFEAVVWIRANTAPGARIAEAKGSSYRANTSRISAMTGRPTLLGWDGHEAQWRGDAYGEMARMRPETLELLYRSGSVAQIGTILDEWGIDYVYVGSGEREQYGISPQVEERLLLTMDLAFEQDDVRIYRRRGIDDQLLSSNDGVVE